LFQETKTVRIVSQLLLLAILLTHLTILPQPTPLCFLRLALPLLLEPRALSTTSTEVGSVKTDQESAAAHAGTLQAHTNLLHLCFYLCELFLCSPAYPVFSPLAVALSAINLARHGCVQHASGLCRM
jgi:hypothetical protein